MSKTEYIYTRGIELRERGEGKLPVITGYAAVFDEVGDGGWFTEEVKAGAFARTLREGADVRALFDHDTGRVLGRRSAKTLTVAEDAKGLAVEIDPPNTQTARDLVELIRRGDITGMSFGFRTVSDRWSMRDGKEHRELLDVDLFEVSAVVFPFYEGTSVAVRSGHTDEARQSMERWNTERLAEKRVADLDSMQAALRIAEAS